MQTVLPACQQKYFEKVLTLNKVEGVVLYSASATASAVESASATASAVESASATASLNMHPDLFF